MSEEEHVRITVTVSPQVASKIDELAERMGASQSKMASMLMEQGLEDNEWIIRFVTTRTMKGLNQALRSLSRKGVKRTAKGGS